MRFPRMVTLKQHFSHHGISNVEEKVREEVGRVLPYTNIRHGDSVAITVGSRGIANLSSIVRTLVRALISYGCKPFIVPCMGSHGGATAEGQKRILEHYGITEKTMGAPVISSMEVKKVGKTDDGLDVYVDSNAVLADHIVVFNRIKPHTDFRGQVESGLLKMMTIGLGKHKGAQYYHQAAVTYGGSHVIETVGKTVLKVCNVAFGLACIEDAYDQTALVEAILPERIEQREKELLVKARELMAKLPFEEMDILLVDQIGKNISGTGMDTNVVGRIMNIYTPDPEKPKITRIVVRDLTDQTEGNAIGIGMADFITKRLADKIDYKAMYTNTITGLVVEKARLPIVCSCDRDALEKALLTIGLVAPEEARVIWIRDTLSLETVAVSEEFLKDALMRKDLEVLGTPWEMKFDVDGSLESPWLV
ncbi:lactate racemase domain-containing protein [Gelria sp. Kuro-4]|uniref:lactate racemase domain-containing protein n=1 Tax=Gelria sp. Kuro-4 TaxID=2796927 RepID=UPI001BF10CE0|nr:lactate racemase domain-containing protein [Gelria sp. Kuro-4]BCV24872.1 hypothetical protein kuro4_16450 [Gelria sp. Kuro-4]